MSNGLENRNKAFEHQTLQTAKHTMENFVEQLFCIKYNTKFIKNICETFSLRIYVWSTSLEETSQSFTDMCRQQPSQKIYISKLLCCSRITAWNTGTAENWETFVHRPNCINTINNTTVQCNSEDFFFSI